MSLSLTQVSVFPFEEHTRSDAPVRHALGALLADGGEHVEAPWLQAESCARKAPTAARRACRKLALRWIDGWRPAV